ncbi:hypothetical protein C1H46_036652 [Malus baccata]|uniref:Gamma interferon inducible lysosomal thiol reductase GILT n=1 Tax=Malus baccata TaxID=106549 RepID=A0A540KV08_MALBA|nr:hypothetical protein C1H46_036652 [Malus baccata]
MAAATYLFFTLIIASTSCSFGSVSSIEAQKLTLSVYYETLCPRCATFIVKNLARIFDNELITILNLRLVPWGNASTNNSKNATFCQHGPDECRLNSLEACAIDVLQDVNVGRHVIFFGLKCIRIRVDSDEFVMQNKHFALIYCIEFLAIEGRHKEWQTCFSSLGLPLKPVLDCYESANATKLELKYANETAYLSQPLKFVPWLVLNNQPIGNDYENFASYVCKAYKGDHGIDSATPPLFPLNPQVADHHLKVDLTIYYSTLLNLCFLHRATGTPIDFGQGSHGHYRPPASAL